MALFPNSQSNASHPGQAETIIGPSVKVEGIFHGEGNVTVEGIVQGTLKTNHDLTIGQSAKVKAEVSAKNLILSGEIRGNVTISEHTRLSSTAKVYGNLQTTRLAVEEGAIIQGKIMMGVDTERETSEQRPERMDKKINHGK
ncbi:MAG: polymer-forming cytoskeletal protein [Candidatus Kerfeldbacteria bacterium]|nr:polymer-forming cytoskeletal protein [Candidatus Kerfeldbacteria bacterium]